MLFITAASLIQARSALGFVISMPEPSGLSALAIDLVSMAVLVLVVRRFASGSGR